LIGLESFGKFGRKVISHEKHRQNLRMRLSLRRIVFPRPRLTNRSCVICRNPQFSLSPSQNRRYSNIVKDSDAKVDGVESTGAVDNDPDIIATESPEIQQSLVSPELPTEPPSPSTTKTPKKVIHFRIVDIRNPKEAAAQLRKAMTETSLRRKLGWSNPLHGVNPAYDMAIAYLKQDRQSKIQAIKRLEKRIARERKSNSSPLFVSMVNFC